MKSKRLRLGQESTSIWPACYAISVPP